MNQWDLWEGYRHKPGEAAMEFYCRGHHPHFEAFAISPVVKV